MLRRETKEKASQGGAFSLFWFDRFRGDAEMLLVPHLSVFTGPQFFSFREILLASDFPPFLISIILTCWNHRTSDVKNGCITRVSLSIRQALSKKESNRA